MRRVTFAFGLLISTESNQTKIHLTTTERKKNVKQSPRKDIKPHDHSFGDKN